MTAILHESKATNHQSEPTRKDRVIVRFIVFANYGIRYVGRMLDSGLFERLACLAYLDHARRHHQQQHLCCTYLQYRLPTTDCQLPIYSLDYFSDYRTWHTHIMYGAAANNNNISALPI